MSPHFRVFPTRLMSLSGWQSWKNWHKTSCNNRPKRTGFSFQPGARGSLRKPKPNVQNVQKAARSTNNLAWLLTLIPIHKPSFMYVLLGTVHPPSSRPGPTEQTEWVRVAHHSATLLSTTPLSLNCHFELSAAMDWQGWLTHSCERSGYSLALQRVLASPASRLARRERAGQVTGQGAALILHKCGGNPLPPCWL